MSSGTGTGIVVLNWEDFMRALEGSLNVDIGDIDFGGIEDILKESLPEIIGLLEDILNAIKEEQNKYRGYNQRIIGYNFEVTEKVTEFEFISPLNCFITGIAFSHNNLEYIGDYFDLVIERDNVQIILQNIAFKDALQHKHFNMFLPLPSNTKLKIRHHSDLKHNNYVWYDLEYLEYDGFDSGPGIP